jgi:hypothetical protein
MRRGECSDPNNQLSLASLVRGLIWTLGQDQLEGHFGEIGLLDQTYARVDRCTLGLTDVRSWCEHTQGNHWMYANNSTPYFVNCIGCTFNST